MVDILGDDLARTIGPIWGTNDEGELRGCYVPHSQPNLWMAMGAMSQSRTYSKYLVSFPTLSPQPMYSAQQALQLLAHKYKLVSA